MISTKQPPPLCKCGCGLPVDMDVNGFYWLSHVRGHYTKRGASNPNYTDGQTVYGQSQDQPPPLCKCGCGQATHWITGGRRFATYCKGHYLQDGDKNHNYSGGRKRENPPEGEAPPLCDCGCGQTVTWSQNGYWRRFISRSHATKEHSGNWKGGYIRNKLKLYTYDWVQVSKKYRASVGWLCEDCGKHFSDNVDLLHTHHLDEDSKNNDRSNLRAVCFECHGKYHGRTRVGGSQPSYPV